MTHITATEYDQEWSRKINRLGPDGRLAQAREDLAGYADFPAGEVVDLYDQARDLLAMRDAKYRQALEAADPLAFVAQARFLQSKAAAEVLRAMIIDRCDR